MRLEQLCSDLVMIPREHLNNLFSLAEALAPLEEKFFKDFGYYWKPTNGYRFMNEHVRIYNEINKTRKAQKKKLLATPIRSQHLFGNAVDIYDPMGDVKKFVYQNKDLYRKAGIYIEGYEKTNGELDWRWTPNWVHKQRVAPGSGKMFFIPY